MAGPNQRRNTLTFDIGGTGLKAAVLGPTGKMLTDRHRIATPHPLTPAGLVEQLRALAGPLPEVHRISAGFPGVVRHGRLLTAHNFVGVCGPGSTPDPALVSAWRGFDLASALVGAFGVPARVVNDADLQGFDVVAGHGVEVVITLGTGVGSALFDDGRLAPHLELAHHPFRKGETYEEQLGELALRRVGPRSWNRRLRRAIETIDTLLLFDRLYVGGGNARHIDFELPPRVQRISPNAGLLAGIKLWRRSGARAR